MAAVANDERRPRAEFSDVQSLVEDLNCRISSFKDQFSNANDLALAIKGKMITQHGETEINIKVKGTPPAPQGRLPGMFDEDTLPSGMRSIRTYRDE